MTEKTGNASGPVPEFEEGSCDILPDIPIDPPDKEEESFGKLPQPEPPGLQPPGL